MQQLLKRPDEFYVGFKEQTNSVPLAFLTPFDTTAAFKKRKETVDYWARGNYNQKHNTPLPAQQIKNEPIAGYKLSKSVRRHGSWNGGNVVWRIEDPRGFEWEIPSENMAQIMIQSGVLVDGIIPGKCIIGRLGSANVLIPEGTDLWVQMELDMETRKKKASTKPITNLRAGDAITLKDGTQGFYLGKHGLIIKAPIDPVEFERLNRSLHRYNGGFMPQDSKYEYHLIVTDLTDYNYKEGYYPIDVYKGNPPVVSVDTAKFITDAKVEMMMTSAKTYFTFRGLSGEVSNDIISYR